MYKAKEIELEMRALWRKIDLLRLLRDQNKKGEPFFLLDGPPYANNIPHVGHIRNVAYKDLFIRRAFMQGKSVLFQPGFDTHGLPIESIVEKTKGFTSKKDIEQLGVANFVAECRKLAATNMQLWMSVFDQMGSWYSWEKPYLTYENSYVQSAWWAFKQLHDKGMVYEGKRPVYWCPHCETALAGYEVTDSYQMVSDPAIYVKFKLKDVSGDPQYLLVFTTTPWTLISNVAVAVHPDETYVRVKTQQGLLILAKPRLQVLTDARVAFTIQDEFPGKDLEGKKYSPIIDVPIQHELATDPKAHKIILSIPMLKSFLASKLQEKKGLEDQEASFAHFVTMDDGTGLVHTAPGHGKTDYVIGQHYGLPAASPLDDQCKYTSDAGPYAGKFCKNEDKLIIKDLEASGHLFHHDTITHKYPLCWRCKSKLIFRLSDQWFIKIEPIKEAMLKANEQVDWQPDFARTRFHNWVSQAEDWNVSRQRYWGIPLPIWRSEDKKEVVVIGSIAELNEHLKQPVAKDFDLHAASDIVIHSKTGKTLKRVNDIADVWYDSGVAPFASLGFPFHNKEVFERHFPVSRINESQDQIRGWFYSLMFCSVGVFGKAPYKQVSMPGWVLDAKGDKMSKSKGNFAGAKEVLDDIGGDILRFYLFWDIAPYEMMKFNLEVAKKEVTKVLNVLWNLHVMVPEGFKEGAPLASLKLEDRWILSRLHEIINIFSSGLDNFEFHMAGRALADFVVDDVSRWYIQLVRERMDEGDTVPLSLLRTIIIELAKLLAPITPHIADKLYLDLTQGEDKQSVHLVTWPRSDKNLIAQELSEQMAVAQKVVAAVLSARDKVQIGLRWPIKEAIIVSSDARVKKAVKALESLITAHVNARKVSVAEDMDKLRITIEPDMGKIAADFKQHAQSVAQEIRKIDPKTLAKALDEKAQYPFKLGKESHHVIPAYVTFKREMEGPYAPGEFKGGHVYIETTRTPELDAEGYAREIARRIQALRKKAGLHKDNDIDVHIQCDKVLAQLLEPHKEDLASKVGAKSLVIADKPKPSAPQWSEKFDVKKFAVSIEFDVL